MPFAARGGDRMIVKAGASGDPSSGGDRKIGRLGWRKIGESEIEGLEKRPVKPNKTKKFIEEGDGKCTH